jgi:hypothetical protein
MASLTSRRPPVYKPPAVGCLFRALKQGSRAEARSRKLNFQPQQCFNRTETVFVPARSLLNLGIPSQLASSPEMTASFEVKSLLDVHSLDSTAVRSPGEPCT